MIITNIRLQVFILMMLTMVVSLLLAAMSVNFLGVYGIKPVTIKDIGNGNIATGNISRRKRL